NTTAEEIYRQTAGKLTHLVVGIGTSGTAMGTTRRLRELKPSIKVITLQPQYALHNLEGWKHMETAIQPGIYDPDLADDNLDIDGEKALGLIKQVAEQEGLLLSPSAAGNLLGAIKIADQLSEGVVVTVFPDSAENYSEVMKSVL
ncbi:MAG: pyridoxal-phosphate dependent enzyme, partial [Cyclobacteriaceae bacterium]|nr:pyridoxal-phosphate dependent enzyme [Cyclobacteriaceae bacterium]